MAKSLARSSKRTQELMQQRTSEARGPGFCFSCRKQCCANNALEGKSISGVRKKKYQLSFQGGERLVCQLLNHFMFCPDGVTGAKTRANVAFRLTNHNHSPVAPHTPTLIYSPILWSCMTKQIRSHGHQHPTYLEFLSKARSGTVSYSQKH